MSHNFKKTVFWKHLFQYHAGSEKKNLSLQQGDSSIYRGYLYTCGVCWSYMDYFKSKRWTNPIGDWRLGELLVSQKNKQTYVVWQLDTFSIFLLAKVSLYWRDRLQYLRDKIVLFIFCFAFFLIYLFMKRFFVINEIFFYLILIVKWIAFVWKYSCNSKSIYF